MAKIAKTVKLLTMPTTMNISLSDELKSFVDERVKSRGYSTHSEYVRDLVRRDEQEAAWRWVEPIMDAWKASTERPKAYTAGTWGPAASSALLGRDGLAWHEEI